MYWLDLKNDTVVSYWKSPTLEGIKYSHTIKTISMFKCLTKLCRHRFKTNALFTFCFVL